MATCCYCAVACTEADPVMHRDGHYQGPLVPICVFCFLDPAITAEMVWERTRKHMEVIATAIRLGKPEQKRNT